MPASAQAQVLKHASAPAAFLTTRLARSLMLIALTCQPLTNFKTSIITYLMSTQRTAAVLFTYSRRSTVLWNALNTSLKSVAKKFQLTKAQQPELKQKLAILADLLVANIAFKINDFVNIIKIKLLL